jgi:hypothetical protein
MQQTHKSQPSRGVSMVNGGLGFAVYMRVEEKRILCDFGFLMNLRVPLLHVQIHYYRQNPLLETSLPAACFMLVSCLAYSSTLKMEATFPLKRRLNFIGLHSVKPQKKERLIVTIMRTPKPRGTKGKVVPALR